MLKWGKIQVFLIHHLLVLTTSEVVPRHLHLFKRIIYENIL